MLGVAVARKWVYGNAAAGREDALDLDVAGIHQLDQIVEDDVDTVFVKVAVVPEREQIQLEALALDHPLAGNV